MENFKRKERQLQYEERMDRLANIGKKRLNQFEEELLKSGYPFWYTDFSLIQLQYLNQLKDAMFKDKEEQTTFRTIHSLSNIGMITNTVRIKTKIVRKYLNKYNSDPTRFLCEIYKALSGNYFENEKYKTYSCTERIILSAIAFLELPKIILALQKRLPPTLKVEYPPKPQQSKPIVITKEVSPYLEKMLMPVNWRRYREELDKWREKCFNMIKPVVILPKIVKIDKKHKLNAEVKEMVLVQSEDKDSYSIRHPETELEDNSSSNQDIIDQKLSSAEFKPKKDEHSFELENWTTPPSLCPFKYRKLMEKLGPLKTDKDFFNELGYKNEPKCYPAGRENLSIKMQSFLLGLEDDLFKMSDDVDKLTSEVGTIAKEIFNSGLKCDPCCVCKQTQKTYLASRNKKSTHLMIDSVVEANDDKIQVIGATAMLSPVSSISSYGEPPYVPSSEKLIKNVVIDGTTVVDGKTVAQLAGVVKAIEHVPHEILLPENDTVEIKNVPPCGCFKESESDETDAEGIISKDKNPEMCYGKKYRPDEGPVFTCKEFANKMIDEPSECKESSDKDNEDDFICASEFEKYSAEAEYENSVKSESDNIQEFRPSKLSCKVCHRCGMPVESKCVDLNTIKLLSRQKRNQKTEKESDNQCSCYNLSDFLKFDISKSKCSKEKQKIEPINKELKIQNQIIQRSSECQRKEFIPTNIIGNKKNESISVPVESQRNQASSQVLVEGLENDSHNKDDLDTNTEPKVKMCKSINEIIDESGPYGTKTKSEEELPTEHTIVYLVPPKYPLCQVPVAEGKRPCKCRENRNKRKTAMFNIVGCASEGPNPKNKKEEEEEDEEEDSLPRIIDGVAWISPVPSIRRSDEYIPEYELYDSPYDNACATTKKFLICEESADGNNPARTRSQDWKNSFNDAYLTEAFDQKKGTKISCTTKCSKFPNQNKRPRQLEVVRPVCECKYERKIVKRKEEGTKWNERQNRLKSLKKQPFIQIGDISMPSSPAPDLTETQSSNSNDIVAKYCSKPHPQMVISSITMQTPVITPAESKYNLDVIDEPYESDEINQIKSLSRKSDASQLKSSSQIEIPNENNKSSSKKSSESTASYDEKHEIAKVEDKKIFEADVNVNEAKTVQQQQKNSTFYDDLTQMRIELEKMASENFISAKLPDFYKMPQLVYWISYRAKGMRIADAQRTNLMKKAIYEWAQTAIRIQNRKGPPILKVTKKQKETLNFNKAMYWKKKIAQYKLKFYTELRNDLLNLARDTWGSMHFGAFPNTSFKEAYFTYLPSREKDLHVVCMSSL